MGEIGLNSARLRRRKIISKIIAKYDLEDLIKAGFSEDGYGLEVDKIETVLNCRKNFVALNELIKTVFSKQFLTKYSNGEIFDVMATELVQKLGENTFLSELDKLKALNGKLEVGENGSLKLTIHKDFVVEAIGAELFINGKFFEELENLDLKETLIEFSKNDSVYYCQYITRHRWQKSDKSYPHFKIVSKDEYDFFKLPNFEDIECVFDIEKAIPISEG